MIKRLGKHAVPLPKLVQLIENLKSSELIINGDVVMIKKEKIESPTNQSVDCATQTEETLFQGTTSDEKVQLLVERLDKLGTQSVLIQNVVQLTHIYSVNWTMYCIQSFVDFLENPIFRKYTSVETINDVRSIADSC